MDVVRKKFPSPHSGILFLSSVILEESAEEKVSVPLFGDSFFMSRLMIIAVAILENVSVPLFGDSFFICNG